MMDTLCGKRCEECTYREASGCPGCKAGPGRNFGGDCELAKCVRSKGHETCETCGFRSNCNTLRARDQMPDRRRRKLEAEQERQAAIARRTPVLGKWLWILFWLVIPSNVASLMTRDAVQEALPGLFQFGQVLALASGVAYAVILIRLKSEDDGYRTAGICILIGYVVNFLLSLLGESDMSILAILVVLPGMALSLYGNYREYMAHSAVLAGLDNDLSGKWEMLWKWEVGTLVLTVGGLVLALIMTLIGVLAALAGAIGTIVVGIMKLVYLYRTAKTFRDHPAFVG